MTLVSQEFVARIFFILLFIFSWLFFFSFFLVFICNNMKKTQKLIFVVCFPDLMNNIPSLKCTKNLVFLQILIHVSFPVCFHTSALKCNFISLFTSKLYQHFLLECQEIQYLLSKWLKALWNIYQCSSLM